MKKNLFQKTLSKTETIAFKGGVTGQNQTPGLGYYSSSNNTPTSGSVKTKAVGD